MAESVEKPQAPRSETEKAKIEKDRAEETDTSRAASAKSGSPRENAGVRIDGAAKVNSGAKISARVKAQTGAKVNTAARSEAVPVDSVADPTNYINCELSWLEFNYRVLSESRDKSTPLFERFKFLSITAFSLDGFCMVKVASLRDMVRAKYTKPDVASLALQGQLDQISKKIHELVEMQYSTYNRSLVPILRQSGLRMVTEHEDMTGGEAAYTDEYFRKNVYPVLTPIAFDSSKPFPLMWSRTLNIVALLKKRSGEDEELEFAMMQVPSVISRIVELPREIDEDDEEHRVVILLGGIIERNIPSLFLNYGIVASHPFRITRSANLTIDEEEAVDLLEEIQKQLRKHQWDEAIRLEVEDNMDKRLLRIIRGELSINSQDIFEINGPLDLMFLMKMYELGGFELSKASKYVPQPVPALMNEDDVFTNIRKGDILFHHPCQSFDPVVSFVRSAVWDQSVLAIKQTLYRVNGNSPVTAALAEVTDNGRQVLVLVELEVRFDKENNINWTEILEKAGCHVIYGLVGLKTRDKIILAIRMEKDGARRYVHLSIGNYNDSTAKLYTDCGIPTYNLQIRRDATVVLNMLSGYSEPLAWSELSMAPLQLRG